MSVPAPRTMCRTHRVTNVRALSMVWKSDVLWALVCPNTYWGGVELVQPLALLTLSVNFRDKRYADV